MRLSGEDKTGSLIDQCVALDADCRLVMDSCEMHFMRLNTGVLQTCLGDGVMFQRVDELRCVRVQNKAKDKHERRRNPKWSEKRRKENKRKWQERVEVAKGKNAKVRKVHEIDEE